MVCEIIFYKKLLFIANKLLFSTIEMSEPRNQQPKMNKKTKCPNKIWGHFLR